MKKIIFCVLGTLVFLSCTSKRAPICPCCSGPDAEIRLLSPAETPSKVILNNHTIEQINLGGSLLIYAEPHPSNPTLSGATIVYSVNGNTSTGSGLYFEIPYVYGQPRSAYTKSVSILQCTTGVNTIDVYFTCSSTPGVKYPAHTPMFKVIKPEPGAVTLQPKCCDEAIQLQMNGSIVGGGGYIKIEKQIGTTWTQKGLVPFVAGGLTPCYEKAPPIPLGVNQKYRADLVDFKGNPIINNSSGTSFPFNFEVHHDWCLTKEDNPFPK